MIRGIPCTPSCNILISYILSSMDAHRSVVHWLFCVHTKCFVHVRNVLYPYEMFCTCTKCFIRVRNVLYAYEFFVRFQNVLYSFKMFCTHSKCFVRVRNVLYAFKMFCTRTKCFICVRNVWENITVWLANISHRMHKRSRIILALIILFSFEKH